MLVFQLAMIDEIVMVGGMTRMPKVINEVKEFLWQRTK